MPNGYWNPFLESRRETAGSKILSILIRYSQFPGHATSGNLLENFNKSLVGLDLSKIIQNSMDGPNIIK